MLATATRTALRTMATSTGKAEARLAALGYVLPTPSKPVAAYVMSVRVGNLIHTAGHLPQPAVGPLIVGKVGQELTVEEGAVAARAVGLNILATLKDALGGDLDRVVKVVKLTAFVNCVDGFAAQPVVANGASELMRDVFGEAGMHARSAVGVNALPRNVPVEIEAIVEVRD